MNFPVRSDAEIRATSRNDFGELGRLVRREGLLDRRYGYYAVKISLTLLAFAGGAWCSRCRVTRGGSW